MKNKWQRMHDGGYLYRSTYPGVTAYLNWVGNTRADNRLYTVFIKSIQGDCFYLLRRKGDVEAGAWTCQAAKRRAHHALSPDLLKLHGLIE